MREALLDGIRHLCWLYPPLRPSIRYSEVLSPEDYESLSVFLGRSPSRIRQEDVDYIENILFAASGQETVSSELSYVVAFLRTNTDKWQALYDAYDNIVRNRLVNTCPLVVSGISTAEKVVPFGKKWHSFQEFHRSFHESIHYVLEENGLCFNDEALDEGFATYLHQQVMGKKAKLYYTGEGRRLLRLASVFEEELRDYPRSSVVPLLLSKKDWIKAL